jgi:acyl carrier protein
MIERLPMNQAAVPTPDATDEVIRTVNELMQSGFELEEAQLVPEAKLQADLGLDSLDAVDMLVYIEEKMGVKIEGERLLTVKTLQDVYILAAESVARSNQKSNSSQ